MNYAIVQWTSGPGATYQLVPYNPSQGTYPAPSPGRVLSTHPAYAQAKAALDRACPLSQRMMNVNSR
jgi:hypothetical protein